MAAATKHLAAVANLDPVDPAAKPKRPVRTVELAVRRDLRRLPKAPPDEISARSTLEASAVRLAQAIDSLGPASPSTLAKLVDSLRLTMERIVEVATGDADGSQEEFGERMSTAVFDAADPGPSDAGPTHS